MPLDDCRRGTLITRLPLFDEHAVGCGVLVRGGIDHTFGILDDWRAEVLVPTRMAETAPI